MVGDCFCSVRSTGAGEGRIAAHGSEMIDGDGEVDLRDRCASADDAFPIDLSNKRL